MTITITAFAASPDEGRGQARDMRVRWALEELGLPCKVRLVSFAEMKAPPHRALNPFGQIPTCEDGEVTLFESAAIVLHLAERHAGLLPADPAARSRAVMWVIAALNSVEPPIVEHEIASILERKETWHAARRPMLEDRIRTRLDDLAAFLGDREWLEGEFTAGDLVMIGVLRRLEGTDLLEAVPPLAAYVARGEARPAFRRAFAAQKAVFDGLQR